MPKAQASKRFKKALFIHRRDLRVQDNTGLNDAITQSDEVLSCFIFDPVQISDQNAYKSDRHVQFMVESLEDLSGQYEKIDGRLHLFHGTPHDTVQALIEHGDIDAVFVNADYTPYSKIRDEKIQKICTQYNVEFTSHHDLLLCGDPDTIRTQQGKPFTVFTPFWRRSLEVRVPKIIKVKLGTFVVDTIRNPEDVSLNDFFPKPKINDNLIRGGRAEGRKILKQSEDFKKYKDTHNDPNISTTHLSAHNKFGTVSIREVYHSLGKNLGYTSPIIRQLYWRDFYTAITYHFPKVIGNSFDEKHNIIFWNTKYEGLEKWKEGKTGFPFVDAGMRELNATGFMHNRARLAVGSFLTKDLHIGWWEGEQYFAQKLLDYDINANNGNWQWVGGTGTDPVPYFRIFNPWLQGKRFDPEAEYIKKWVPELKDISPSQIHTLFKKPLPADHAYPQPMVDHTQELRKVKEKYKK